MWEFLKIIAEVLVTLAMSVLAFRGISVSAETVTFTVEGGTDGTDYTYDSTTGVLTIPTTSSTKYTGSFKIYRNWDFSK